MTLTALGFQRCLSFGGKFPGPFRWWNSTSTFSSSGDPVCSTILSSGSSELSGQPVPSKNMILASTPPCNKFPVPPYCKSRIEAPNFSINTSDFPHSHSDLFFPSTMIDKDRTFEQTTSQNNFFVIISKEAFRSYELICFSSKWSKVSGVFRLEWCFASNSLWSSVSSVFLSFPFLKASLFWTFSAFFPSDF